MHIKFLSHGTGEATKATAYVLADKDHQGITRAGVRVLRGNPEHVAAVADSLPFLHRYTSGVISWHADDKPTPEQVEKTLDEFERLAFAGLDPERYCWTAVEHIEPDGSIHIHILVARVDLITRKSLNIAPPGWQKDFDPLRDMLNHSHSWARPDDPARARLVQPGHEALKTAAAIRAGLTPKTAKEEITNWLTDRIASGAVTDRQGIISSLSELGEITRAGKDYISVKPPGFDKAIRLKGAIYEEQFNSQQLVIAHPEEGESRPGTGREIDHRAVADAQRELTAAISRRTEYNSHRYRRSSAPIQPGAEQPPASPALDGRATGDSHQEPDKAPDLDCSTPDDDSPVSLPADLLRNLGILEDQPADRNHHCEEWPAMAGNKTSTRSGLDDLRKPDTTKAMQALGFLDQLKATYDRTRNAATQGIGRVIRGIRQAVDRLRKAGAGLERQAGQAESITDVISRSTEQLEQQADRVIQTLEERPAITSPSPKEWKPTGPKPTWF